MAIGVATIFVGYWVGFYGWCSLKGPGVGLLDLIVPGRLSGHVIPNPAGQGQQPTTGQGQQPTTGVTPVGSGVNVSQSGANTINAGNPGAKPTIGNGPSAWEPGVTVP